MRPALELGSFSMQLARRCQTSIQASSDSVPVVLPSPALLAAFDTVVAVTEEQRSRNATMAETLAEIRDALLPRLISGQLRLPNQELQAA
jgi:hypothetical protein